MFMSISKSPDSSILLLADFIFSTDCIAGIYTAMLEMGLWMPSLSLKVKGQMNDIQHRGAVAAATLMANHKTGLELLRSEGQRAWCYFVSRKPEW